MKQTMLSVSESDTKLMRLFWRAAILFCLVLPLINGLGLNAVINGVYAYLGAHPRLTAGSRLFWEILVSVLEPIVGFARVFFHFFGYGLFTLALFRFGARDRRTWQMFAMALCAIVVYPLCGYPLAIFFSTRISAYDMLYVTFNALLTFGVELFILACVMGLAFLWRHDHANETLSPIGDRLAPRAHPLLSHFAVVTLVHGILRLAYTVYETVTLVLDNGGPEAFVDYLALCEPYLSLVLYSFVGYYALTLLVAAAEARGASLSPSGK